jgi:hypothetical protein
MIATAILRLSIDDREATIVILNDSSVGTDLLFSTRVEIGHPRRTATST